jgi:predicted alpha/beta superfamily hydrolase
MKIILRTLVLILVWPMLNPAADAMKTASVSWRVGAIRSTILREDVAFNVFLPDNYQTSRESCQVLYITDISWPPAFPHAAGIVRLLNEAGWMPRTILVGIGCDRSRDLTPSPAPEIGPNSGHADRFLDFIEKELVPRIEREYRTNGQRLFWGHSISGALGLYALLRKPALFQSVLATSPWFIYDIDEKRRQEFGNGLFEREKGFLLSHAREWLAGRTTQKNFLFMAIGDEPQLMPYFDRFCKILETQRPAGLTWKASKWPGQTHQTMALHALTAGLVALFPQK